MRGPFSSILAVAALGLLTTLSGCADRTAILVEVTSADIAAPTEIDSLTIRAISVFGSMHEDTYPLSASWPHSLTLIPAPQEGIGGVRIDVTGTLAGRFVVRRVYATEFVPGTVRRVQVVLARACVDVMCADGVDCISGMCSEGSPDAGPRDGGSADGGEGDAGPSDAGMDAALQDAPGLDAPVSMDTGLDAPVMLVDTGVDGGRDAGPPDAGPPDARPPDAPVAIDGGPGAPTSIFFSEYVEGSGSNKALEIYNAGSMPFDLSTCVVNLYSNGGSAALPYTGLTGTLLAGDVYVLCHGAADATLMPSCDVPLGPSGGALAFNGDDAVELVCGGTTRDIIGQIGFDPGTRWGAPPTSTLDATLRRNCTVTSGDTIGSDAFVPATEWTGVAIDTFSGLGTRGCP